MAEKILMLALSPTMQNGTIARWRKKEGDRIKSGEVLCEVETDKATMEYEAIIDGTILKILVPEGKNAAIGDPIAIVGNLGEDITLLLNPTEKPLTQSPALPLTQSPALPLAQSPALSLAQSPALPKDTPEQSIAGSQSFLPAPGTRIKASPLARRLASEQGLELSQIQGSGPQGRIVKRDVAATLQQLNIVQPQMTALQKQFAQVTQSLVQAAQPKTEPESLQAAQPKTEPESLAKLPLPALGTAPAIEETKKSATPIVPQSQVASIRLPISQKRKIIAQRLTQSKTSSPHYYLTLSVNMDGILEARKKLNATRSDKVSMNAFLIKFCGLALAKHPEINVAWREDYIEQFQSIDIGLAVAQTDGLITPVVRDCAKKGLLQIHTELQGLIDRALSNKLGPEEFQNATFTISNLGSLGIEEFTAIINPPGSAILAVGAIQKQVVVENDEIMMQSRMKMTMSCDHRVIDGIVAATFLKDLKDLLESPVSALY